MYRTWCLLHAEVYMKSSDSVILLVLDGCWRLVVKAQSIKIDPDTLDTLRKSLRCVHNLCILSCHACVKNVIFTQYLPACNSGTARWKNLVPGSYCRATQELSNGGWIMGIGWSKPGCPTSCTRHFFFERLRKACTKPFTAELVDVSRLSDLNKKEVEELLYLLVFVWSPRSEVWPR